MSKFEKPEFSLPWKPVNSLSFGSKKRSLESKENVSLDLSSSNDSDLLSTGNSTAYYESLTTTKKNSIFIDSVSTSLNSELYFPMNNVDMIPTTKKAIKAFWTPDSVKFDNDNRDYKSLQKKEQNPLKLVFAFFARMDSLVQKNLLLNYFKMVQGIPEATYFFSYQMFIEAVHGIVYAKQIHETIANMEEVSEIMINLNNSKAVKMKEKWALDWIEDESRSEGARLLAFVFIEGVGFISSFAIIDWFKFHHPGKLTGVTVTNTYIRFDETTHADFSALLVNKLNPESKPSEKVAHEICVSLLEVEKQFCNEALQEPLPGLSANQLFQYCQFIADYWLHTCGYSKLYNVENPFIWLQNAELQPRAQFFEIHSTNYTFMAMNAATLATEIKLKRKPSITEEGYHNTKKGKKENLEPS